MLTPELRTYLEKIEAMSSVPADDAIKDALFSAGWNDESIRDALSYVSVIKQRKAGEVRASAIVQSLPVVHDVSFVGEEDGQSHVPTTQTQTSVFSKPIMSASAGGLHNGKSSQSVLYPDNSSRLGLRGEALAAVRSQKMEEVSLSTKSGEPPVLVVPKEQTFAGGGSALTNTNDVVVGGGRVQEQEIFSVHDSSKVSVLENDSSVRVPGISPRTTISTPPPVRNEVARSIDGVRPAVPTSFATPVQKQVSEETLAVSRSPVRAPAQSSPRVTVHRSNRFVKRVGVIAVLLGVFAAIGYAYIAGIGPFASVEGPYRDAMFASDFLAGIKQMKSGVVTGQYQGRYVTPSGSDEVLLIPASTSVPFIPFFPNTYTVPGTAFSLSISSTFDRTQQKTEDFQLNIDGSYIAGGDVIAGTVEVARIDDMLYTRFSKVPTSPVIALFLGDMRDLEGKWISLNASTTGDSSIERYVLQASTWGTTTMAVASTLLDTLVEALESEQVISVSSKERIPSWKGNATRYYVSVSFEKLAPAFRRVLNHILTTRQDVPVSYTAWLNSVIAKLESNEYVPLLTYFTKHTMLIVDVADDGIPLAITQSMRVLLPELEDRTNETVFESQLSFSFANTNKPIELRTPDDVITLSEASRLLMNLQEDEYRVSLQLIRVNALAQAIETFQQVVGRFPKTLDELVVPAGATLSEGATQPTDPSALFLWNQYKDRPFLPSVPVDVFTQKPFVYSVSDRETEYTLAYMIVLPEELRSQVLGRYSDWSYELGGVDGKVPKWRVVSGKNTLTETHFSVEGKIRRK